jgi:hypothetical protein
MRCGTTLCITGDRKVTLTQEFPPTYFRKSLFFSLYSPNAYFQYTNLGNFSKSFSEVRGTIRSASFLLSPNAATRSRAVVLVSYGPFFSLF